MQKETVLDRAKRILGPPKTQEKARDRIPREDIVTLRKAGYNMSQIGKLYDVCSATIYRIYRRK